PDAVIFGQGLDIVERCEPGTEAVAFVRKRNHRRRGIDRFGPHPGGTQEGRRIAGPATEVEHPGTFGQRRDEAAEMAAGAVAVEPLLVVARVRVIGGNGAGIRAHAGSRRTRGTLNSTLSLAVSTISTVTSKRAQKASMTSLTNTSGAEAPAVTPTVFSAPSARQSMSVARLTSWAYPQPAARPTSTRRREFDEFGAPMTSSASILRAMAFTASCRFVVA